MGDEFQEIGHCGGRFILRIQTGEDGMKQSFWQFVFTRPVPAEMVTYWVLLTAGLAVAPGRLGGDADPPPMGGCTLVMIASDSEGRFGHTCQACRGYWRSGALPNLCPYCRHQDGPQFFLSDAQRKYVRRYCELIVKLGEDNLDREFQIDFDEIADAVGREGEKPAFYVSETSQQNKFTCDACGEFNDVLGQFAYCSCCGTRNDLDAFRQRIAKLRQLVTVENSHIVVRDAISAFDTLVGQIGRELLRLVPLSRRRAERLRRGRFHDLEATLSVLMWFDIDLTADMAEGEKAFLRRMFLRRHVYEHNGGEVDQVYLEASGDDSVRLKQHIRERVEDLHRLLSGLNKMAQALVAGFHELFPPLSEPIDRHAEHLKRISRGQLPEPNMARDYLK
ncbi:hypothetical protein [Bosea sp. BK604]|uniref:hypothetical protein n=1 Tax=Bosea sp. BK604 TaxID=2512180 RepID=UPI00104E5566|nr:hypothetical protein [Bosea sp. BK604]TCR70505.1 hypothetical protein EV560_101912 [Bosea sp. BK604]